MGCGQSSERKYPTSLAPPSPNVAHSADQEPASEPPPAPEKVASSSDVTKSAAPAEQKLVDTKISVNPSNPELTQQSEAKPEPEPGKPVLTKEKSTGWLSEGPPSPKQAPTEIAKEPVLETIFTSEVVDNTAAKLVRVIANFAPELPGDLDIKEDDVIEVVKRYADGWWSGILLREGTPGLFPSNYVEPIETPEDYKSAPSTSGASETAVEQKPGEVEQGEVSRSDRLAQLSAREPVKVDGILKSGKKTLAPVARPKSILPQLDPNLLLKSPKKQS
jgi:hypothetical protein